MFEAPPLKITRCVALQGNAVSGYSLPLVIGAGPTATTSALTILFKGDPQTHTPAQVFPGMGEDLEQLWVCRGKVFRVEGSKFVDHNELIVRIQHAALIEEKALRRIQHEVQAFENLQATATARRERIPDEVKLFVWQRDEGKCVSCGSNERLEFDHVIPVVEGGSNTARNVQLLCEPCNRQKGKRL